MKRTVNDVMTKTVVVVGETAPYKEIVRLLDQYRVNSLPVVDERDVLIGIVTQTDLLLKEEFADENGGRRLIRHRRHGWERTKAKGLVARDVMASPVITTTPDASLARVARMLHDHGVKQVPVTDPQGKVVGIVSRRDLLGCSFGRTRRSGGKWSRRSSSARCGWTARPFGSTCRKAWSHSRASSTSGASPSGWWSWSRRWTAWWGSTTA